MNSKEQIASGAIQSRHLATGNAKTKTTNVSVGTVATTGNTDAYIIAPVTGTLSSVYFSCVDALAAHDTNYVTFSIVNLGANGSGTTDMLDTGATNTTKVTGGSALSANTRRTVSVHGTAENLAVTAGDRLRVRVAASGTLANTLTFSTALLTFAFTA